MILADWIAIGIILVSIVAGIFIGFGSGLKFFTSGIFGFIIGVVVCALFGTVFLDVGFVGDLLEKFRSLWAGNEFLEKLHLEIIIYYVILFFVIQLLRILIVLIIKKFLEADNFVCKLINRVLGAALFLLLAVLISLLAVKIVGWVGGETADNLYKALQGSLFNLDGLFEKIANYTPQF